ncbi:hypothetical protein BDN71DRAFT_1379254 [Pleurotus eryngii]|uniref:Transcription activator of gluconeogenesis ERT1 n=1 Tax=Pleurotus eryngii TaxID=5323 RepID=A0A9P6DKF8_PLEER|nr:hypothetical protein BDN71DRAFT_1379254 [Pleurotus eryngii]
MPIAVAPAYINPSDVHNAHAGPSSSPPKKKPLQPIKRKRTDTPDDTTADAAAQQRKNRDGPKKKKANRACFHCQKAHLTCDDSRPCQRCIKRGIASNCTEGLRKKAKYLLDEEELDQLKRNKSAAPEGSSEPPSSTVTVPPAESFPQNDPMFNVTFDPNFPFGSEAANLEYSILSAILGNPSPGDSAHSPPAPQPAGNFSSWTNDSLAYPSSNTTGTTYGSSFPDASLPNLPSAANTDSLSPSQPTFAPFATPQAKESPQTSYAQSYTSSQPLHPLQPRYPLPADYSRSPSISTPSTVFPRLDPKDPGLFSPLAANASPISTSSVPPGLASVSTDTPTPSTPSSSLVLPSSSSQLQSINDSVTTPYDYTEGYHFLMKHLPSRFEKNDILRIVRALAIFRPSLIALQMPLSLDDEIFVEKCFQRSLLEMEKLISYSGTPTVVWRRTGEICLVAPEFCMLTEWPMDELVDRKSKKYIYELFENQSVVEYWENFASHAFENTTQSVYSHCVLLKPDGAPVPTTFCFSIRRDLFDLPSMVIGTSTFLFLHIVRY